MSGVVLGSNTITINGKIMENIKSAGIKETLPPITEPGVTHFTINTDYKYVSFVNTGATNTPYTITFNEDIECDILVVGGGGGGGSGATSNEGSGGGAGGVVYMINKNFNSGTYKINVGKGGTSNNNGNNSSITTDTNVNILIDGINLIGIGGGGGTGIYNQAGKDGGSGSGGCHLITNGGISTQGNTFWNGSIYIPGGYAGEKPVSGSKAGGGGGSAEIGGTDGQGAGGDGRAVSITGTSIFYAGGGGGVNPGGSYSPSDGGGGIPNPSYNSGAPSVGIPNTGSGGGGSYAGSSSPAGAFGGSGIVIIRYKIIKTNYEAQWTYSASNPNVYHLGNVGIGTTNPTSALHVLGSVQVNGVINATALTANTKNFKIEHPLNINKWLYHGCVEAPRFDNIYRGKKLVINGICEVDIDEECNTTGGMTKGTFVSLNTNFSLYVRNNQTYDRVYGIINGSKLTINCENIGEEIEIDWLIMGERKDENIITNKLTNYKGSLICEHDMD